MTRSQALRESLDAARPRASVTLLAGVVFAIAGFGLVSFAGAAIADDDSGSQSGSQAMGENPNTLYFEYQAGYSYVPKQTLRGKDPAVATFQGRTVQKKPNSYNLGAALGGQLGHGLRGELAVNYRRTRMERMAIQPGPTRATHAHVALLSVMGNGYFDLDLRDQGTDITPWVGAGIGWGMPFVNGENNNAPQVLEIDDTDSVLVYNVMAGVFFPLSESAGLNVGYRYVATEEIVLSARVNNAIQRLEYEYDAHEAFLGLRFRF